MSAKKETPEKVKVPATQRRKMQKELEAVDEIIKAVFKSASDGDFNLHILKVKDNGQEELVEKRLASLDTKRILEAAATLEKAVAIKKKLLDDCKEKAPERQEANESTGLVILPPIVLPEGQQDKGGE